MNPLPTFSAPLDAGARPLAAIQDVIDQAIDLLRSMGAGKRAEIEAWADAAVATIALQIPQPMLRWAIAFIGPRLVDAALDAAFGPDNDNT